MLLSLTTHAAAPVVSGVSGHQRTGTKLVDITYTATDADGDPMSIAVSVSYINQAGTVISVPVRTLSGDGANGVKVASGTHALGWDAGTDWPGQFSDNFTVAITADDAYVYLVIDLSGGTGAVSYPISYLNALPSPIPDDYRTTKLVMKRIRAGTFTMGSPVNELGRASDERQHQVTLTKDVYIGVFEVTQKQWERVMGTWPSYFNNTSVRDVRPVEQVSCNDIRGSSAGAGWPANSNVDATSFMGQLRQKTGLTTLDLPTEAQWEYACRAGTTTALNNGTNLSAEGQDANLDLLGRYWYNGGSSYSSGCGLADGTAKVGSYQPNAWGLYDMHGNVWEWCLDWYGAYPNNTAVSDPAGPASSQDNCRVLGGGSWNYSAMFCRSAGRYGQFYPVNRRMDYGFRLLMTVL
jgi:formylglycine-generating enzyme required for sulfatase activity